METQTTKSESQATAVQSSKVFAAIELSQSKWVVAIHRTQVDKTSIAQMVGGDTEQLLAVLHRSAGNGAEIHTCYEAGHDGFWLHRLLVAHGIHNEVVDSASIQVSRRRRKVKTDRIDAESMLRVFMAWHRGEPRVCSIVRVPSVEEEDLKRIHRSRLSLLHEQVRLSNRIKGLLSLQGNKGIDPDRKGWMAQLKGATTGDGRPLPKRLVDEIRREGRLLATVCELMREVMREIDALSRAVPKKQPRKAMRYAEHPIAARLLKIHSVGPLFAAIFATEVFYRKFRNRREVASYLGLTPTPYASGATSHDQGISKAGNAVARHHAIEFAWLWVRNQPQSRLAQWFLQRAGDSKGRLRRIAIVALARKLMIALWRYVETGLIPEGAIVKA